MDHKKHSELTYYKNSLNTLQQKEAHLSNISTAMTDGNQKVQLMSLATNGQQHQLGSDNNNNLKCNVVSAVSVLPHNSADGEQTPSTSFNVKNNDITKGNSTIASGGTLQSVLMYGRKPDGTLEPLECNGDRLLVDVVEMAVHGKITTSTALSSMQICAFSDTDSRFKSLKCDSNGILNVKTEKEKILVDVLQDKDNNSLNGSLAASAATESIDARESRSINIYVSNPSANLILEGSDDNTTFYEINELFTSGLSSGQQIINIGFDKMNWNYIRLKAMTPFTFGKILIHKLNL